MSEDSFESSNLIRDLLVLNHPGMGRTRDIGLLLKQGKASSEILGSIRDNNVFGKKESYEKILSCFDPVQELNKCKQSGIEIISLLDERYPVLLRDIYDPPIVLYAAGNLIDLDQAAVAIVGSRHPSIYGMTQAKKFSRALTEAGLTIVSGLAKGIDQCAHEAALENPNGRTIAVLGSGLDVVYPPQSEKLFGEIGKRGAILSEYPLGTAPLAMNFPKRNRIISGLSLGVLVVEAHTKSGSLITAREALEQGREVFAIPGSLEQITAQGTNQLLKDGAGFVIHPEDILETLSFSISRVMAQETQRVSADFAVDEDTEERVTATPSMAKSQDLQQPSDGPENDVLEALKRGPLSYNDLLLETPSEAGKFFESLLSLEIAQKIKKDKTGRYCLSSSGRN